MKLQIIGWFLVGIIAFGVGFYIYKDISPQQKTIQGLPLEKEENQYELEITPIVKVNSIDILIPVPNLNRPIIFDDNFSKEEREKTIEKINKLTEELKKNNSLFFSWIELGLYRKLIEDYEGAKEVWEYTNLVWPKNNISFGNLGDLYGYYLNNQQKAEENFLKAIKNNPNAIEYYFKTVEFYYDVAQNTTKARQIVQQGIQANPNSDELKALLNTIELLDEEISNL